MGTKDISSIGDGTAKGAIYQLNNEIKLEKVSVTGTSIDTYSTLIAKLQNQINYNKVTYKSKLIMIHASGLVKVFNVSQLYQNTVQLSCANIPGGTTNWLFTIQVAETAIYYLSTLGTSSLNTADKKSESASNVTLEFIY